MMKSGDAVLVYIASSSLGRGSNIEFSQNLNQDLKK